MRQGNAHPSSLAPPQGAEWERFRGARREGGSGSRIEGWICRTREGMEEQDEDTTTKYAPFGQVQHPLSAPPPRVRSLHWSAVISGETALNMAKTIEALFSAPEVQVREQDWRLLLLLILLLLRSSQLPS